MSCSPRVYPIGRLGPGAAKCPRGSRVELNASAAPRWAALGRCRGLPFPAVLAPLRVPLGLTGSGRRTNAEVSMGPSAPASGSLRRSFVCRFKIDGFAAKKLRPVGPWRHPRAAGDFRAGSGGSPFAASGSIGEGERCGWITPGYILGVKSPMGYWCGQRKCRGLPIVPLSWRGRCLTGIKSQPHS